MKRFTCLLIICCAMGVSDKTLSGEISTELQALISQTPTDQPLKVWIKVNSTDASLKADRRFAADEMTLADRHREGIELLKSRHKISQQPLLKELTGQKYSTGSIKPHWVVNVIEAELTAVQISAIASRSDVEKIYTEPLIELIKPETEASEKSVAGVESNLTYINAPGAWSAGYTGQGRVVCSFDTGVDGNHTALRNSWKGLNGDSAAAWFDPATQFNYPHAIADCGFTSCNSNHGTHVMGIMAGHNDVTGDTVGVAPDAQWISAAVIDIAGVSIIDAFEWAADPDGDPNTIADVPDVINHSWGVRFIDCENIFYDIIDNLEAMGIVNIFAAGNEGTTSTIRNPADRAIDSLDCFAVGNINHSLNAVHSSSSRGPSLCPVGEIKPNVSAPGVGIRSTIPGGVYGLQTGTSMAAPHVSGLVALLREKNPNATVDQIKTAILAGVNNMSQIVPNNNIGWGRIDCLAALNALSAVNSTPNVNVYDFEHLSIDPGDTIAGIIVLTNTGSNVNAVIGALQNTNSALTILDGSATFGSIATGAMVPAVDSIKVVVADTVRPGAILSLDLNITGSSYNVTRKLYFAVGEELNRSQLTHNVGNIDFTITNYGVFGLGDESFFPLGGAGFSYLGGGDDMYEGGLMIGSLATTVSDGARNAVGEPDGDFAVTPGGNLSFVTPLPGVTQQSYARFDDSRAEEPIGLDIEQRTFAFSYNPYQDFVILQYFIKNTNGFPLTNLYVGLHFDWDVIDFNLNAGGYDALGDFGWIARNTGVLGDYRGVKVIDGTTQTVFTGFGSDLFYPTSSADPDDGYTETEKISALSAGFTSDTLSAFADDLFQVVAARINLAAGQTDTVSFALIAGQTLANIRDAASGAANAYVGVVTDAGDDPAPGNLPNAYRLEQNYPNPFNPETTIKFHLPRASHYQLCIYNLLGQTVHRISAFAKAGEVILKWDASKYSSGVYLYELTAGEFVDSKKMVLQK